MTVDATALDVKAKGLLSNQLVVACFVALLLMVLIFLLFLLLLLLLIVLLL